MIEVPFEGPCTNGIYLVGEAPGEKEVLFGKVFAGSAGNLLNRLLLGTGILREQSRLGNVMRTRPLKNDFGEFYLDKSRTRPSTELEEGRKFLREDIKKYKPKVVVPLGNEPLVALMGIKGITQRRGSIYWSDELQCKVIPTIHPSAILRQYDYYPLAFFDMHRIKEEVKTPYIAHNKVLHVKPSFEEAMYWLGELWKKPLFAFDIETLSDEGPPYMTAFGFAHNVVEGFCIPFTMDNGDPYWTLPEELAILNTIKRILEDGRVEKIAQNGQFDISVLLAIYGIRTKGLKWDSMICQHVCYPELPKSLAVICSLYTKVPFYKDLRLAGGVKFWEYNAMDAVATFDAQMQIIKEMEEFGVTPFYQSYVHPLINTLLGMQERGVKVDEETRDKACTEIEGKIKELEVELSKEAGRYVNPRSPVDVKKLIREQGLNVPIRKKVETTNADALAALLANHPNRALDIVMEIRSLSSNLSGHLSAPLVKGRMHASYNIGGRVKRGGEVVSAPETGRLSSSESIAYQSGANLQNVPPGPSREMFIPDEGKVFLSADLDQAEARFVAYDAHEVRLIRAFESGGDPYISMASWIFNKDGDKITKDERYLAKRMVLALNYGMGPKTFAMHLKMPMVEAKRLLDLYFNAFPRVRSWQFRIKREVEEKWLLKNPFGRKRQFFGRPGDDLLREAYAYRPQSTIGDLVNIALVRADKEIEERKLDMSMVFQVHDQYILQIVPSHIHVASAVIKKSFDIEVDVGGRLIKFPYTLKMGPNWDELEEIKDVETQV